MTSRYLPSTVGGGDLVAELASIATQAASSCAPSASPSDPGPQSRSPALTGAAMVFPGGASGHCHASLYRQDG